LTIELRLNKNSSFQKRSSPHHLASAKETEPYLTTKDTLQ